MLNAEVWKSSAGLNQLRITNDKLLMVESFLRYLCNASFQLANDWLGYIYDDEDIVAPKLENSILANN